MIVIRLIFAMLCCLLAVVLTPFVIAFHTLGYIFSSIGDLLVRICESLGVVLEKTARKDYND